MLTNCQNCGAFTRACAKYCPECGHSLSKSTTPISKQSKESKVPQKLAPGLLLKDRYRIVAPVGIGGLGVVYRGWDRVLHIPCAIRVELDSTDEESEEQFIQKVSYLARLVHAGLPHVWDQFSFPNQGLYLVMTYIHGCSLQTIIDSTNKPLAEKTVLPWIEQICDVLEYIHSQKPPLIHRNIKPRHIYITQEPLHDQAMLGGFGISAISGMPLPKRAQAVTSGFSPPEQYGLKEDTRVDVFGLGAALYYLLTRKTPSDSLERKHSNKPLIPPRKINPKISIRMEKCIMKALELNPDDRYNSINEFKKSLVRNVGDFKETQLAEVLPAEEQIRESVPIYLKNEEEIDLLEHQLIKRKRILIELKKQEAEFFDPRAVPIDLVENIRLIKEDIKRKRARLRMLGVLMEK